MTLDTVIFTEANDYASWMCFNTVNQVIKAVRNNVSARTLGSVNFSTCDFGCGCLLNVFSSSWSKQNVIITFAVLCLQPIITYLSKQTEKKHNRTNHFIDCFVCCISDGFVVWMFINMSICPCVHPLRSVAHSQHKPAFKATLRCIMLILMSLDWGTPAYGRSPSCLALSTCS